MSSIKYTEALEIAAPTETVLKDGWTLTKKLIAENIKLKEELAYFQSWMLSGDGKLCTMCERCRHVDDMQIPEYDGRELDALCCSDECAARAVREFVESNEEEKFIDNLWRNR